MHLSVSLGRLASHLSSQPLSVHRLFTQEMLRGSPGCNQRDPLHKWTIKSTFYCQALFKPTNQPLEIKKLRLTNFQPPDTALAHASGNEAAISTPGLHLHWFTRHLPEFDRFVKYTEQTPTHCLIWTLGPVLIIYTAAVEIEQTPQWHHHYTLQPIRDCVTRELLQHQWARSIALLLGRPRFSPVPS